MGRVSRNSPAKEDKEILSHALISTVGTVKTYRFTYSDGTTFDYVINHSTSESIKFLTSVNFPSGQYFLTQTDLDHDRIIITHVGDAIIFLNHGLNGEVDIFNRKAIVTYQYNAAYTEINNGGKYKQSEIDAVSTLSINGNVIDHIGALTS